MNTRRKFLIQAPLGLIGAVAACNGGGSSGGGEQKPPGAPKAGTPATPGAPPAFNTAPPVGPEVGVGTFAEAEKLAQVTMTDAERRMAAGSWRTSMAPLLERRTGPRKIALEPTLAPATRWEPASVAGAPAAPRADRFVRTPVDPGPLPADDADIAFAPVTRLSRWLETRALTSERLTRRAVFCPISAIRAE